MSHRVGKHRVFRVPAMTRRDRFIVRKVLEFIYGYTGCSEGSCCLNGHLAEVERYFLVPTRRRSKT